MANPQPRPFIRLSQELFEAIYRTRFNGPEWQVLMFIVRMTYGFGRKEVELRVKHFVRGFGDKKTQIPGTNLDRKVINRARNSLWKRNVISWTVQNLCKTSIYSIQKDYDKWEKSYPQKTSQKKDRNKTSQNWQIDGAELRQNTPVRSFNCDTLIKKDKKDKERKESKKAEPVENFLKAQKIASIETAYFEDQTGQTIAELTAKLK